MKIEQMYRTISVPKRKGLSGVSEQMAELQPLDYNIIFPSPLAKGNMFFDAIATSQDELSRNIRHVMKNGGTLSMVKCANGKELAKVADYRNVPFELIDFDPKTVDNTQPPPFVPIISLGIMENKAFIPDAIRIANDAYLFTDKYSKFNPQEGNFSLLTLDQLVSTVEFYYTLQKRRNQIVADQTTAMRKEQYFGYDPDRRAKVYDMKFRYTDLPAKNREKISSDQWKAYTLEQKEAIALPFKIKAKPVITRFGRDTRTMPGSYHTMYEDVIDPSTRMTTRYANKTVFNYFMVFSKFLAWKILDFAVIRKGNAENANKAFQTSFGRIGASDELYYDYGIVIKRQNGDAIKQVEVDDIDQSLVMSFKTFGDFTKLLSDNKAVISHANLTNMYARKSIGIFVPNIPAVGISRIGGIRQFYSTASHEFAHYIDYFRGTVGWYNSMNYESLEGKIAAVFRSYMRGKGTASEYFNSTIECFARAMQQYFTMKWFPDNEFGHFSLINIENPRIITETPYYCSESDFNTHVKPIIDQWVKENGLPAYNTKTEPKPSMAAAQAQRIRILALKYKYKVA